MLNHEFLNVYRGANSNLQDSTDIERKDSSVNLGRYGEIYSEGLFPFEK